MKYVKTQIPVSVELARAAGTLETPEGFVNYDVGDALVTGVRGERWPIGCLRFEETYDPVPPTQRGQPGLYLKAPLVVEARQMKVPFEVPINRGGATVKGNAGDWLVTAPDLTRWIVQDQIFRVSYKRAVQACFKELAGEVLGKIFVGLRKVALAGTELSGRQLPEPILPSALQWLERERQPIYRLADMRAQRYANLYRGSYWLICVLTPVVVLSAVVGSNPFFSEGGHYHEFAWIFPCFELLVLLGLILLYRLSHKFEWHGKFLAHRRLAELLRYVPIALPLYVIESKAGQQYLSEIEVALGLDLLDSDVKRTKERLMTVFKGKNIGTLPVEQLGTYLGYLKTELANQSEYHMFVHQREHALYGRLHHASMVCLRLTIVAAVLHFFLHGSLTAWLLLVVATFMPASSASLHALLWQGESQRLADLSLFTQRSLQGVLEELQSIDERSVLNGNGLEIIEKALGFLVAEHEQWHDVVRIRDVPIPG